MKNAPALVLVLLVTLATSKTVAASLTTTLLVAQSPTPPATSPSPSAVPSDATVDGEGASTPTGTGVNSEDAKAAPTQGKISPWLWVLFPVSALALWLAWLKHRQDKTTTIGGDRPGVVPPSSATVPPGELPSSQSPLSSSATPPTESTLASRTESVISSDRAAIAATGLVRSVTTNTAAAAAAAAAARAAQVSDRQLDDQSGIEASKFDVGQTDLSSESLASVDEGLAELPDGYGESRIVLLPRDAQWAYAYWDISNEHKVELRQQGGERLALRFCDVTDVDLSHQNPHSLQQYECDEMARDWHIPVPVSDRDYVAEIGYIAADGRWLLLARSAPIHTPPIYPTDWFADQFLNVEWEQDLRNQMLITLRPPRQRPITDNPTIYDQLFDLALPTAAQRVAGSLFGSMHQVPGLGFGSMHRVEGQPISSYIFPSGIGMGSGMGMSGIGMMSGVGWAGSMPAIRPRQFWLVADAELIVYGATEPDATVTIAGQPIRLSPDGTFRFQLYFPDGNFDYPVMAVDTDGEQNRSIHMKFLRETPEQHTNTKADAEDEWLP